MLNFFIYFIDFLLKRKCYKTQNNRKFKQKIGEKSIKIFTTLLLCPFILEKSNLYSGLAKIKNFYDKFTTF